MRSQAGGVTGVGAGGLNQRRCRHLVLQQVGVVDIGRSSGPEDGHDDGQADHDLGRHHHGEGGDDPAFGAVHPR